MTAINPLILTGLIFPHKQLKMSYPFVKRTLTRLAPGCGLHSVHCQIFAAADDAKAVALERGFPLLALRELPHASENEEYFDRILLLCPQFADGFPHGQRDIFEQWWLETLIGMFHPFRGNTGSR
jgi:hypothetical protein